MMMLIRIKSIHLLVAGLLISLLLPLSQASGQAERLGYFENAVKSVAKGFKVRFCPGLSGDERRKCERVRINVVRSWGFEASASRDGIRISAGVGYVFDTIDWARMISNEVNGNDDCFNAYMQYFYEGLDSNTKRSLAGKAARPIWDIVRFSEDSDSCETISAEEVKTATAGKESDHARGVETSLVFILLHELGHIELGHPDLDPSDLSLEETREAEADADRWAIETANASDYLLGPSMAPYFIGNVNGGSTDWEKNSDHPLGIRRIVSFYQAVVTDLEDNPHRQEQLGEGYEKMLDGMREALGRSAACLAEIDSGSETCK